MWWEHDFRAFINNTIKLYGGFVETPDAPWHRVFIDSAVTPFNDTLRGLRGVAKLLDEMFGNIEQSVKDTRGIIATRFQEMDARLQEMCASGVPSYEALAEMRAVEYSVVTETVARLTSLSKSVGRHLAVLTDELQRWTRAIKPAVENMLKFELLTCKYPGEWRHFAVSAQPLDKSEPDLDRLTQRFSEAADLFKKQMDLLNYLRTNDLESVEEAMEQLRRSIAEHAVQKNDPDKLDRLSVDLSTALSSMLAYLAMSGEKRNALAEQCRARDAQLDALSAARSAYVAPEEASVEERQALAAALKVEKSARGQGRPLGSRRTEISKHHVWNVLTVVRAAGGFLTVNKNDQENPGSLSAALDLIRPHLPPDLIPVNIPLSQLAEVQAAHHKATAELVHTEQEGPSMPSETERSERVDRFLEKARKIFTQMRGELARLDKIS
jgi:hypothetical protein